MHPTTNPPERRSPRAALRTALFLSVPGLVVTLAAMGHVQARVHASNAEVRAQGGVEGAGVLADDAVLVRPAPPYANPPSVDPEKLAAPVFEALDFVEESGSIYSLPYLRVCGLSINAPRSVFVIEGPMYQTVVEGANLEPLYRQIQKREIGMLKADSLANGDTYSVPVVPLPTLMELSKAKAAGLSLVEIAPRVDAVAPAPFVGRVRVALNAPFHFDGRSGAYVSDDGGK